MASIFVAKLDFGVTEEELRNLFEQYGRVAKASIALDKETRKPRGFAFVEMNDAAEAAEAIKNLDGSTINGRQIAVKEADQRPDNRSGAPGGRPDFNRNAPRGNDQRPGGFNRNQNIQSEYKKPIDDKPVNFTPAPSPDSIKPVVRKIDKDKKPKDWDSEGRAKKPKMNAYKKSGKNPKFFDDDDDDDWDLPLNKFDDEEDFDDDEEYEDDED
jgi:RNA recognition motif-containing protein